MREYDEDADGPEEAPEPSAKAYIAPRREAKIAASVAEMMREQLGSDFETWLDRLTAFIASKTSAE